MIHGAALPCIVVFFFLNIFCARLVLGIRFFSTNPVRAVYLFSQRKKKYKTRSVRLILYPRENRIIRVYRDHSPHPGVRVNFSRVYFSQL